MHFFGHQSLSCTLHVPTNFSHMGWALLTLVLRLIPSGPSFVIPLSCVDSSASVPSTSIGLITDSDHDNFIPDVKFIGTTSSELRLDYGNLYASKSFFDYAKNRRILWGWVEECDTPQDDIEKGYRSSLRQNIRKTTYGTIFDIDPNLKTISLRSLIDRSIIKSFGDVGKVSITSRVYPSLAIDKDAHLFEFNHGSQGVRIPKLNAWSMKQAEFGNMESTIEKYL